MKGFREFVLRGNVLDLAVAVAIGAAFTAVVQAVVASVFTPLVGALFDARDLRDAAVVPLPLTAGTAELRFGAVLAALVTFLVTALVVYVVFVVPANALRRRSFQRARTEPAEAEPSPPTELDLLVQIRDLLQDRGAVQGGDRR